MKKLYIIGARGCGRETYNLYKECNPILNDIDCVGFLDDKKDTLDGFDGYPPIISSVEEFIPSEDDRFICALGDPKWVKYYTDIITNKGGKFISLISPHAYIGSGTLIGDGCQISRWAMISCDIAIGNHVYIGVGSVLGHDVSVADYSHLGPNTFLGGGVLVGECVTIHPRVNVLPHKKIGNNAVLGAASVIIKSVNPNVSVFGNPAKKIQY